MQLILSPWPKKYCLISPVFASTFIPPAYFMFAKAKNKPKGVLKFINTLLIIELLSIILENESLNAGNAIHKSPLDVSFTLSG